MVPLHVATLTVWKRANFVISNMLNCNMQQDYKWEESDWNKVYFSIQIYLISMQIYLISMQILKQLS